VLQSAPEKKQVDFCEITFQTETETQVLDLLRNYGAYQNIDCYLPYLENENENDGMLYEKSFDPNTIDNKKLSESIINLTLKESQNLITKSTDLVTSVGEALKLETKEKSLPCIESDSTSIKQKSGAKVKQQPEESKLKRNEATTSSKKKTLKNISNLTLNNCGGSIILKNISNLTINTCKQTPKVKDTSAQPVKACTTSKSCDGTFYQCDFYERLISENEVLKRSIVNQSLCTTTYPDPIAQTCMSPPVSKDRDDGTYSIKSGGDTTTSSSIMEEDGLQSKHEKLDEKIEEITTRTMMADGLMNHPPMIQCWLNKMLLETETEAQNITEFLEISNIV
jgi:hypothetical protein